MTASANYFLDRATVCVSSVCSGGPYTGIGGQGLATAGMALLCIAGIFSAINVGLTLLKRRAAGFPAANAARVVLSALALAVGIIGVVLVRSAMPPHPVPSNTHLPAHTFPPQSC